MIRHSEKELSLRIDTKNNRRSIHRYTLAQIGDPKFIHFGFHPETMSLIVLGTWADARRAIRVHFVKSGAFYVYSKPLFDGIRVVCPFYQEPGSYLLRGKRIKSIPAISFSLRDIIEEAATEEE